MRKIKSQPSVQLMKLEIQHYSKLEYTGRKEITEGRYS